MQRLPAGKKTGCGWASRAPNQTKRLHYKASSLGPPKFGQTGLCARREAAYFTETPHTLARRDLPAGPSTSRMAVESRPAWYWCMGFCTVDVEPSPKSHFQDVMLPSDSSLKAARR